MSTEARLSEAGPQPFQTISVTSLVERTIHLDQKLKKIDSELLKLRVQQVASNALRTSIGVIWFGLGILSWFSSSIPQFLWNRKFQILKGASLPLLALGYLSWHEADRKARITKLSDRKETIRLLFESKNLSPYRPQKKFLGLSSPLATPVELEMTKSAYKKAKDQQIIRLGEKTLLELKKLLNNPKPGDGEDAMSKLEDYQERSEEARDYLFSGALPYILSYAHAKGVEIRRVSSSLKIVQISPAQWGESVTEQLECEDASKLSWVNYLGSSYLAGTKEKPLILMRKENDKRSISLKTFFKIISDNQNLDVLAAEFVEKFWGQLTPPVPDLSSLPRLGEASIPRHSSGEPRQQ